MNDSSSHKHHLTITKSSVYNCDMIESDKRLIQKCSQLLVYNFGSLTEISKCRGVLNNMGSYHAMTPRQRLFLTEWYERNQDQMDYMRF